MGLRHQEEPILAKGSSKIIGQVLRRLTYSWRVTVGLLPKCHEVYLPIKEVYGFQDGLAHSSAMSNVKPGKSGWSKNV